MEVIVTGGRVVCPHCGSTDIVEIDSATRVNRAEFDVDDGLIVGVRWTTGDYDFTTDEHRCDACQQRVTVPLPIEQQGWVSGDS
jgi:hypothetical protein